MPTVTPAQAAQTQAAGVGGSLYAFTTMQDGQPVRWNPCSPIHWKFRNAGAPPGALAMAKAAVGATAAATRLTFVYDGVDNVAPTAAWLPRSEATIRPLLIGFTDAAHSDLLRGQGSTTLAVTRTSYFVYTSSLGRPLPVLRAAVIALDRNKKLPLTGVHSWQAALVHELGHAVGLAHAGNKQQLMNLALSRTVRDYQAGDKAGLAQVGRGAGCLAIPTQLLAGPTLS